LEENTCLLFNCNGYNNKCKGYNHFFLVFDEKIFISYTKNKINEKVKTMEKELKNNLRLFMAKKGVRTMVELEEKSGVSRQVLDRLEKNKSKRLDFDTVTKLCMFFECEVGDLFYLE
jgi:putative transcriptional regulator